MTVPGSSWRNWDKNFPEQPPTEQDQESIVDPQSKLQPNESLALAGRVKVSRVWHCYPPETRMGGTAIFYRHKEQMVANGEC